MAVLLVSAVLAFVLVSYSTLSAAQNGGGGGVTVELWCVAKNNAPDAALQTAIDWACGPGGADCGPIQQGGPCYDDSDIGRTASYAFNDYFLKHGMSEDSCNFDNTAALTSLNPSHGSCKLQSSKTVSGTGNATAAASTALGSNDANLDSSSSSSAVRRNWGLIAAYFLYAIISIF